MQTWRIWNLPFVFNPAVHLSSVLSACISGFVKIHSPFTGTAHKHVNDATAHTHDRGLGFSLVTFSSVGGGGGNEQRSCWGSPSESQISRSTLDTRREVPAIFFTDLCKPWTAEPANMRRIWENLLSFFFFFTLAPCYKMQEAELRFKDCVCKGGKIWMCCQPEDDKTHKPPQHQSKKSDFCRINLT